MNWLYAEMSIWAICPPAVSFRADSVLEAPATENWIDCSPPPHLAASKAAQAMSTTVTLRMIKAYDSARVLDFDSGGAGRRQPLNQARPRS